MRGDALNAPPPGLVLRDAADADLPAAVALLADDALGAAREDVRGAGVAPCYAEAFAEMQASPAARLLVAELDGRVVAVLEMFLTRGLGRRGARRVELEGVRTASALRGRGIGAALVRHAIEEARAMGADYIHLTSDASRTRAHAFWEAMGFARSHAGFRLAPGGTPAAPSPMDVRVAEG